ncbi:hypothetical protein [Capnocytophaga canis]|uniref:Uncharacterized protein n=1 Tax=Capnocytophaga canis TaxID=1848903 RepID=A0A0B7IQ02_9FLAO|nr:hypothetical protein [Capnocytophaga canis]CEN53910.1 hypothetical protein CCAND93_630007 [Capnocytophaga canis]
MEYNSLKRILTVYYKWNEYKYRYYVRLVDVYQDSEKPNVFKIKLEIGNDAMYAEKVEKEMGILEILNAISFYNLQLVSEINNI